MKRIYNFEPLVYARRKKKLNAILADRFDVTESSKSYLKNTEVALIARDGSTLPKSSAFIRLIAPLSCGADKDQTSIKLYEENTVNISKNTRVCIVQRTAYDTLAAAQNMIENLKLLKTPLIFDTDDAFTSIHKSHPEYKEQRQRIEATNYLIEQASQIWVSTDSLKMTFPRKFRKKIHVIKNTLDKRIWNIEKSDDSKKSAKLQLVYMGTATHDSDFELIFKPLRQLHNKYPDSFELTIIGAVTDLPDVVWIKRLVQKNSMYPLFVEWFNSIAPQFDIGLSPLVGNEFNKSKSDIKALDYLAAGIIPVVSDLEPYNTKELQPYIIKVKDGQWTDKLEEILADLPTFRAKKRDKIKLAQKYIWEERSSEMAAKKMDVLLQKLL